MVLLERPETTQKYLDQMAKKGMPLIRWRYERGANHLHAHMSALDREHVRQELEIAEEFIAALRQTYPGRSFVVTHIPCYAVSFYQVTEDAPIEDAPPDEPATDTVWCQHCGEMRHYQALPTPDREFPKAEWGACVVCGNDLVVRAGEIRILLSGTASDGTKTNLE